MIHFFEFSNEILCLADQQGYFTRVNPAWTKTLGWTADELTSRPFVNFVHPDDLAATIQEAVLVIVQPATVAHWHRQGFRHFWRWKSRKGKTGRPPIEREVRDLIRRMSHENPISGAPRIRAELKLLG